MVLYDILLGLWHLPRRILITAITLYQETFSPDHGPLRCLHPYGFCRHHPTCSQYAKEALRDRGCIVGLLLTARRLVSCHPWKAPDRARMMELIEG